MSDKPFAIDEAELHAWIDGQLDPDHAGVVNATVAADAGLAARANAYADQNREIEALFGGVADEPLPERLRAANIASRQARRRWRTPLAASVAWLAMGLTGGWLANDWLASEGPGDRVMVEASRHVAQQAMSAHRVYAVEVLHPVEVFADQREHLVKWLSKRLGQDIRTPDLASLGFELVGGRLLPAEGGEPAAQFMYEDETGRRVTVYVSLYKSGQETAFRYQEMQGAGAFVWLDPEMGYAIAGDIPREPLLAVSKIVYETFEPTH
ncbi:MAG: anti-sigma factor [Alphaproteobacteria bacterium]|jgi:anti-sigma factor RsiW|nr:anti-sigma factor [Alphaproteobacteria bacterium]